MKWCNHRGTRRGRTGTCRDRPWAERAAAGLEEVLPCVTAGKRSEPAGGTHLCKPASERSHGDVPGQAMGRTGNGLCAVRPLRGRFLLAAFSAGSLRSPAVTHGKTSSRPAAPHMSMAFHHMPMAFHHVSGVSGCTHAGNAYPPGFLPPQGMPSRTERKVSQRRKRFRGNFTPPFIIKQARDKKEKHPM